MSLPLVLLHGWGQHGGVWRELRDAMGDPQVLNLELPGHGSAPEADFDLDAMVDAYAAAAPTSCVLMGWSLGGMLALRWAQRHPQQVSKLILIAATPCFGARADWPHGTSDEVQQAFAAQVQASPERALQRFGDLMAEGELEPRGVRRALRAHLTECAVPGSTTLLAGLDFLATTDLRAELQAAPLRQPALLIHGEGDTITSFQASRWLAGSLPQARLHACVDCGHAPMIGHADEVAKVVKAFLDE